MRERGLNSPGRNPREVPAERRWLSHSGNSTYLHAPNGMFTNPVSLPRAADAKKGEFRWVNRHRIERLSSSYLPFRSPLSSCLIRIPIL